MSDSRQNDWAGQLPGIHLPVGGLFEAVDQLRGAFEQRFTPQRVGKGDVRAAVLSLLAERPMHGYQLINEIAERSGGAWKPSPGSVYPTLQLLADEGIVVAEESGGRKTYSLTEAGVQEVDAADGYASVWNAYGSADRKNVTDLPKAGARLAQAAGQIATSGTPEQIAEAVDVLDAARRRLYAILAAE